LHNITYKSFKPKLNDVGSLLSLRYWCGLYR